MHVLVVDDNTSVREALALALELAGFEVICVPSPDAALNVIKKRQTAVVLQDMNFTATSMTGDEGATLFRAIRALDPALPVILMTAWTRLDMAVELVKEGAADYIGKPWDDEVLLEKVRVLFERTCASRASDPAAKMTSGTNIGGLVYRSEEMHSVVELALRVADADVPVLITGPSGCGKERLADCIRANSSRRDRPYITFNAGALPSDLLEAELFGAEAGAFTGSRTRRVGRFEAADGGTLFIDEVGTLPLAGQAVLLRVLESGEYQRLGSSVTRKVDVRVIAATNADLQEKITSGQFREDLFYRLAVIELVVPSLAQRRDDILPLADYFLTAASVSPDALGPEARAYLLNYDWQGNVRELKNRMQRAAIVKRGESIDLADLGLAPLGRSSTPPPHPKNASERAEVEDALRRASGVISRAAVLLGTSRQALYRRMERLGITLERRIKP